MNNKCYEVWAVDISTGTVRLMATKKDADNAAALVKLCVMRRGVEKEFYVVSPIGMYKEGDTWVEDKR